VISAGKVTTGKRALLAIVTAASLGGGSAATGEAQPPIRIGMSLSQTGPSAEPGQNQLRGRQLCVKHANEKGGLLGRRIELIAEDDQSKPAAAVAIYEKLVTQERVDAILGPYGSPIVEAVADVSEKHKLPLVAPSGTVPSIFKKGRRFVFMVSSPSVVYLEGLIDMAAKRGLKTVALIHEDTIFPKAEGPWGSRAGQEAWTVRRSCRGLSQGDNRLLRHPRQSPGSKSRCAGGGDVV
jgi:branched-chain amino acid transport system substrate-binding protein